MSFGGVGAQMGGLIPILIDGATSVIVAPTYDKNMLAKAIHDERYVASLSSLNVSSHSPQQ